MFGARGYPLRYHSCTTAATLLSFIAFISIYYKLAYFDQSPPYKHVSLYILLPKKPLTVYPVVGQWYGSSPSTLRPDRRSHGSISTLNNCKVPHPYLIHSNIPRMDLWTFSCPKNSHGTPHLVGIYVSSTWTTAHSMNLVKSLART